jgi:hypothetical protein
MQNVISSFMNHLPSGVPFKGQIENLMTNDQMNHLISPFSAGEIKEVISTSVGDGPLILDF